MAKKSRVPHRKRPEIDPFDLALIDGGPLPATFSKWRAAWRTEHPFALGLLSGTPSLETVWKQHHGTPMTEADAAAIIDRTSEVEAALAIQRARESEGAQAYLVELHERARIAALPCAHRVGVSDTERAEAEALRVEAGTRRDRLAAGLAHVTAPGVANWPSDVTEGFTPIARIKTDDK